MDNNEFKARSAAAMKLSGQKRKDELARLDREANPRTSTQSVMDAFRR